MNFVTRQFQLEVSPCGRWYFLLAPIHYYRDPGRQNCLVVPRGFASDGASVPRLFWRLFPPMGRYTGAAVLHDCLYRHRVLPRKQADDIFRDACIELGVGKFTAWTMYFAVRAGGWLSYGKETSLACDGVTSCKEYQYCVTRQAKIKLGIE
jgi:hypothetical protein